MNKTKAKIDPYEVLGVDKNASDKQVKDSYRRKAMASHPDRGGDAREFSLVSQAWAMIGDPGKRAEYDSTGEVKSEKDYEKMAIEIICKSFEHALNATTSIGPLYGSSRRLNPIAECRKHAGEIISGTISNINSDISQAKGRIETYESYIKNIVSKANDIPLIENLLAAKIKEAQSIIEGAQRAKHKMQEVKATVFKILDQYEYQGASDPDHRHNSTVYGFPAFDFKFQTTHEGGF